MKKLMSLLMGLAFLTAVQPVWADGMGKMEGMSNPEASSTPVMKHKVKKAKKKTDKKMAQAIWVCPMGDYSGPKKADGKCPKCEMDLVEKK